MKARLLLSMTGSDGPVPAGTIIDHPDAFRLVRHGCAEPADEECRVKADMTPEQMAKAQEHYPIVAAGVWPEDYDAWRKGYMRGYDADGNWIPGPNHEEHLEEEYSQRAENAGIVLP